MAFIDYLWSAVPSWSTAHDAAATEQPSELLRAWVILAYFVLLALAAYLAQRVSGFLFERAAFLLQFAACMILWEMARVFITPARLVDCIFTIAATLHVTQYLEPVLNATLRGV